MTVDAHAYAVMMRVALSLSDKFDRESTRSEIDIVIAEAIRQLSDAPSKRLH
jgi:hypothetical protein